MDNSSSPFFFKTPEESPGFLLWQVSMLWQRKLKAVLDPLRLTHTQFVLMAALRWLLDQQPEVLQIDIARHAKVDKMMTSKILKALRSRGWISTESSKTDKRAQIVRLTPSGDQVLLEALKVVEKADVEFFDQLGEAQADFREMLLELMGGEN